MTPNPTGKSDPVSPLAAARSQPSQVAPLLFDSSLKDVGDADVVDEGLHPLTLLKDRSTSGIVTEGVDEMMVSEGW